MMREIEDLILLFEVLATLQLKLWSARGHLIIPLLWETIIQTFSALSTQSKEFGGRGSTIFLTPMVKSFSADFLSVIESYWTESHIEFCQTSMMELHCESL